MAGRASSQRPQKENANFIHQSKLLEGCKGLQDVLDISEIPCGGLRNVVFFFYYLNFFFEHHTKKKKHTHTINKRPKGQAWCEKHQKLT